MRKKINIFFLINILFFSNIVLCLAECTGEENTKIRNEAVRVKVNYEKLEGVLEEGTYIPPDALTEEELKNYVAKYTYFKIYISNITENLYVIVTNSLNNESITYTYEQSDNGTITFDDEDLYNSKKYIITVYSSNKTNCENTILYTTNLTTPRYNEYSHSLKCSNIPNFYLCKEYTTLDRVDENTFLENVDKYLAGQVDKDGEEIKEEEKNNKNVWENYSIYIIFGIVVILAFITGTSIVRIRKKREERNKEEL